MSKYKVTKRIRPEKLHDLQFQMIGDEKCAEQLIIINGLKFGVAANEENRGKGIGCIRIIAEPREQPKVFVEYHKVLIEQEVAVALGLEKTEW